MREWFHVLRGIDRTQTLLVLLFVALISLTPFTVALVADAVHNTDDLGTAVRVMAGVVGAAYGVSAALLLCVKRRGNVADNQLGTALGMPRMLMVACAPSAIAFVLSFITPWLAIGVLVAEILLSMIRGWETEEADGGEEAAPPVVA
jgi:uncharacterized membrane protein